MVHEDADSRVVQGRLLAVGEVSKAQHVAQPRRNAGVRLLNRLEGWQRAVAVAAGVIDRHRHGLARIDAALGAFVAPVLVVAGPCIGACASFGDG